MDMMDTLNRILEAHRQLRTDMNAVSRSLNDRTAVSSLERTQSEVIGNFEQSLSTKVQSVRAMLLVLQEGLKRHYDFERANLPEIIGEVLMEGLEIEHTGVLADIEAALSVLTRTNVVGGSPDQRVVEESLMSALLDRIRHEKEQHMAKEEAILEIARVALESRKARNVVRA